MTTYPSDLSDSQWPMLPSHYPKWQNVYFYFSRWKREGVLEQIQHFDGGYTQY